MDSKKLGTPDEIRVGNANVVESLTDATKSATGENVTGTLATSAAIITIYEDGSITTRISGLVQKVQLFGALVEAILSVHDFEQVKLMSEYERQHNALVEKYLTPERTDN